MTCDTLTRISNLLPDEAADAIAERLRAAGIRPTLQRLMIARLLFQGDHCHFSAEDLHTDIVNARVPVSLATVYNTLNQFLDAGLLRAFQVEPDKRMFDTNVLSHAHLYDVDTGAVKDVHFSSDALIALLGLDPGVSVLDSDVVIRVKGLEEAAL